MSKRKTYFKIVAVAANGQLISSNVSYSEMDGFSAPEPTILAYTPLRVTRPILEGSKLFAYRTLEYALRYRHTHRHEIWECYVDKPSYPKHYNISPHEEMMAEFWRRVCSGKRGYNGRGREGTVWGDAITLIRKVG